MASRNNSSRIFNLWYHNLSFMIMNFELLNWLGNFINFLIFAYLSINIVRTSCFNAFQMSLSLIGLLASIFIQIIAISLKQF